MTVQRIASCSWAVDDLWRREQQLCQPVTTAIHYFRALFRCLHIRALQGIATPKYMHALQSPVINVAPLLAAAKLAVVFEVIVILWQLVAEPLATRLNRTAVFTCDLGKLGATWICVYLRHCHVFKLPLSTYACFPSSRVAYVCAHVDSKLVTANLRLAPRCGDLLSGSLETCTYAGASLAPACPVCHEQKLR
jgi:hypothetical protein